MLSWVYVINVTVNSNWRKLVVTHVSGVIANNGPMFSAFCGELLNLIYHISNRKAMNRNWSNQKANPALKTKAGNK